METKTGEANLTLSRTLALIALVFWVSLAGAALRRPNAATATQDFDQQSTETQSLNVPSNDTNNDFTNVGDTVDLYTGRLSIRQTDFAVPGIGPEIRVERIWQGSNIDYVLANHISEFGDWALNVPRIDGLVPAPNFVPNWPANRCSAFGQIDFSTTDNGVPYPGALINEGFTLQYGGKPRAIVRAASGIFPSGTVAATSDFIALSCTASVLNGMGQGFQATLPDGTTILFTELAYHVGPQLTYPRSYPDGSYDALQRAWATLYATKVTDRFGNHIDYNYDANGTLTSITGSDGRSVAIGYTHYDVYTSTGDPIFGHPFQFITSITSSGQTWNYGYSTTKLRYGDPFSGLNGASIVLVSSTRPGGTSWGFDLAEISDGYMYCCSVTGAEQGIGTITTPAGGTVAFDVEQAEFARGNVPIVQFNSYFNGGTNWSFVYDYLPLPYCKTKTITGTNLASKTWTYTRDNAVGWFTTQAPGSASETVTVTSPEGVFEKFRYSILFDATEGQLLEHDVYQNSGASTPLMKVVYTYNSGTAVGSLSNATLNAASITQASRPNTTTITQDGTAYTTHYTSFDTYNDPLTIDRQNDFTSTITETRTYNNDTTAWVLGELASSALGSTASEGYTYYAGTDQVHEYYSFGHKVYTYVYNVDGTLQSRTDGNSHATSYSNYYRGIAQTNQYADTKTLTLTVNADGTIHTVQPPRGYTTIYGYDGLSRLTSVAYPTGDTVAWSNRTLTYTKISAAELGMPVGTWRVRTIEGALQRSDYYDGLYRLVLREEKDTGNATAIYTRRSYDSVGHVLFESYPSSTSSASSGINTSYDGLGRQTTSSTTDAVTLQTITYLSGNRKQIQDAAGNTTIYSYQAFGTPEIANVIKVEAPESQTTKILRDNFGHVTSAKQSGIGTSHTRTYIYDSNFRLCKSIDPERGQTVTHYDNASQIDWTAEGQSGSASACDYATVPAGAQIAYSYSAVGRQTGVTYPDTTPTVTIGYDDDGNRTSVSNSAANWTYTYNKRGLLENEQVIVDSKTLTLKRDHNSQGLQSQITYPDNTAIELNPDAWGRPTQLGSYATSIMYFPNGTPNTYALGNGLTYTSTLSARQWLASSVVKSGVTNRQSLTYGYNDDGDLTTLTDGTDGSDSASFGYDGLHRVTAASGCWGDYGYDYDSNNNILSREGTHSLAYAYNPTTSWLTSVGAGDGIFEDSFEISCKSASGITRNYAYNTHGQPTSDGVRIYGWNLADQIANISGVATYTYDGRGKRIKAIAGGAIEYAFYDTSGQLAYTEKSSTKTDFLALAGKPFAQIAGGSVTYLHPDLLGSPRLGTNASGTQIWREHYDPFGVKQANVAEKLGYTSHAFDAESGLTYAQARYYDAAIGRFLSTDPTPFNPTTAHSFNRYSYAENSPYTKKDASGRESGCITVQSSCVDERGVIRNLQTVSDALDEWNMAMGPNPDNPVFDFEAAAGFTKYLATSVGLIADVKSVTTVARTTVGAVETASDVPVIAKTINQVGQEGEAAVRASYNIGRKSSIEVNGRTRIPDGNIPEVSVSEVKNVSYQAYTQQLRDYQQYAQENDMIFDLYLRPSTQVSSPLQSAIDCGMICRTDIPQP